MAILEARGIKKRFGGVIALAGTDLVCEKGRITGLLGANGSGKSTISKVITGVYSADAGDVIYEGKKVSFKNPLDAKHAGIAMVFQTLSLTPDQKVWENIVLGMEKKKGIFLDNADARRISKEILDKLYPGLDIERTVASLSPGERQIVEIAKALSEDPKVLILDEPTAALEKEQVDSLFSYLRELKKRDVAMIFTSHRMNEVMEICDEAIVFRAGENVGALNFDYDEKDPNRIIELITGEQAEDQKRKEYHDLPDDYILELDHFKYGNILEAELKLKKHEVLGIGGLAGQGQEELLNVIAGAIPDARATATVAGKKIHLNSPTTAIRNGIVLVPGDRALEGLFIKSSIYTNTIVPKLALKKQPLLTPRKKYRAEAEEIVKRLKVVTSGIDNPVGNLSGGNQQKVVVGKWLPLDMNVILLADPAKGVDVPAKRDMYALIEQLARENDIGVILYASDNDELISYCDRVVMMYEGKVNCELEKEEITEHNLVSGALCILKNNKAEKEAEE
ncbi:MAG: sugar ABC transporter ATP-binding protein [Clostridia bacterium]|nr:sugar ABC transporter ATP-binding protein [Clostridia bacterium]